MQPSNRTKRTFWILAAAAAIIAVGVVGYVYRSRIKLGLGVMVDETGSRTMAAVCVVLGLFALFCLLLWMLFPILFYFGLKDLRGRTSELNETTKVCACHLARLAEERDRGREQRTKNPSSSGSADQVLQ